MEPMRTCKLFGAIRAVLGIKGALPVIHGPLGCTYHIRYLLGARSGSKIKIVSTELTQEDVVFGAEQKLKEEIIHSDKTYSPSLIVVLSSCSTSIIGEDIFRVARESRKHINAEILAISAGGFEGNQTDGYLEVMMALIDWATAKQDDLKRKLGAELKNKINLNQTPKNKSKAINSFKEEKPDHNVKLFNSKSYFKSGNSYQKSLNLIGIFRGGPDLNYLKSMLAKMGIELNCVLTAGATLEDIQKIPYADLNYSMCDISGIEPCKTLEKRFNTPFLHYPFPMGFSNSSQFFKNICDYLEVDYSLKNEEIEYKSIKREYSRKFKGYKVAIIAGPTRAVALADLALELNMDPVLISLDLMGEYTLENLENTFSKFKKQNYKPDILQEPDMELIEEALRQEGADMIWGGLGEVGFSKELNIPLLDVMHSQELTLGWEGAMEILKRINQFL